MFGSVSCGPLCSVGVTVDRKGVYLWGDSGGTWNPFLFPEKLCELGEEWRVKQVIIFILGK